MGELQDSELAWRQTLRLLSSINESSLAPGHTLHGTVAPKVKARRGRPLGSKSKVIDKQTIGAPSRWEATSVTDVERRSDKTIAVCWADATFGHYREQLWVISIAKKSAICALSGKIIRRGDEVYRPRVTALHIPSNADAMILVASLNRAYPEQA